jgi:hypothetical protein
MDAIKINGSEDQKRPEESAIQELPGPRIDLTKLSAKLQSKFGTDRFEIYLSHDVYSVKAPGKLSSVSLRCRDVPVRFHILETNTETVTVDGDRRIILLSGDITSAWYL